MKLINKAIIVFILGIFLIVPSELLAQALSGLKTIGPSGNYASITAATLAINTNGVSAPVILELQSGYLSSVEPGYPGTLTMPTHSSISAINMVTIRPAVSGLIITTDYNNPAINFNNAKYITIDGRVGGIGSTRDLVIQNLNTGSTANAIQFINDAANNTVKYCYIKGSNTSVSNGVVAFLGTTILIGNQGITIQNCDIFDAAFGTPRNCIYSNGQAAGKENSGIRILNNNIYNFFYNDPSASTDMSGISLNGNNSGWTIAACSFYQTASRLSTSGFQQSMNGIYCSSSTTTNLNIKNNFIGGQAGSCSGSPLMYSGSVGFAGIRITSSSNGVSSVQGNVIQNISITTMNSSTANSGISLVSGSFYCGDTIPNLIGSLSATGSISFNISSAGAAFSGILAGTGSTANIVIKNNQIGGISVIGTGTGNAYLRGISVLSATAGSIISGNTIGSSLAPLSNSTNNTLFGIYSSSTAQNQEINSNNINYLNTLGTSTANQLIGINATGGAGSNFTINANIVHDLNSASTGAGTSNAAAVIGILNTASTAAGQIISDNIIHSLSNFAPTQPINMSGIYYSGPLNGYNGISGNFIHSLSISSTSQTAAQFGINISQANSSGSLHVYNNMVRLGIDVSGSSITQSQSIIGIRKSNGLASFIHNSVYIGGSGVSSGTATTAAFQMTGGTSSDSLVNNIVSNARSNAASGGAHWACIWSTPTSAICNYNIYYTNGSTNVASIDGGVSSSGWPFGGQDANSVIQNPNYIFPEGNASTVDLHLTGPSPAEGVGLLVSYITKDFDNVLRSGNTPVDIGADAGNFATCLVGPGPIYVGVSHLYANLTGPAGLFNAINSIGICGNLTIIIDSDLSEPGTVSLNEWTGTATLTIQSDGILRTISNLGNITNPMIHLSGADRVTFNGSSGKFLRFRNTNTTANSTTAVFQFSSSSTQCTLQNIEIQSNASNQTLAGIVISTGSNQITVDQCNIHDATVATVGAVATGIYSNNVTNIVTVTSCNIYNWSAYGIYFNQIGNGCAITNNHFYYNMAAPASTNQTAVYLGSGNNHNVYNNSIGGSAAYAGGYPWQNNGPVTFKGIYLNLGVIQLSVIDNNRIQNINLSNPVSVNFEGIHLLSGYAYLGYTIGNTIGHASNSGSITIASSSGNVYGIHDESTSNTTDIEKNTIANIQFSSVSGSPVFTAIYTKTAYVRRNRVFSIDVLYPALTPSITGISMNSTSGVSIIVSISNNMISMNGGNALNPTIYGYYDSGSSSTVLNFYFNSINIYGSASGSSSTYAFYRNGSASTELYNNILVNSKSSGGSGNHYSIAVQNAAAQWISDYNDLYTASGILARWNGAAVNTLASWKILSAGDSHSISYLPAYVTISNIHLSSVENCALNGKGIYLESVLIDFDNSVRGNPPDIGADEFVGPFIPLPTSGGNQVACTGGSIPNLSATGTGIIKWYLNPGLTNVVSRGNPFATGQTAAGVYTYYATDSLSGCESNSLTITLTLNSQPTASASVSPASLCSGSTIQLIGSASGGSGSGYTYSWSGPNSFSSTLQNPTIPNAQLLNAGTYSLSVGDGNSCHSSIPSTVVVTVNSRPTANASIAVSPVCSGSTIQLNGSGGTTYSWSGPGGYTSGSQNPSIQNATTSNSGLYSLYVTDANGCISFSPGIVIVVVNSLPVVSFTGTLVSQCIGSTTYALSGGLPLGGTYSGTGVTSATGNFNASLAGVGTKTITYTYSDAGGCTSSAANTINVNVLPAILFTNPPNKCIDQPAFTLTTAIPAGGTYSGTGVSSNQFNPGVAGVGVHTLTYTYTNVNGCTNSNTATITVNALPAVSLAAFSGVCISAAAFPVSGGLPNGGFYSGTGVSGGNFNPGTAGVGTHTISYTYTDGNGCTGTTSNTIQVFALPTVTWTSSLNSQCASATSYALSGGLPAGGTYSGTAVSGGVFNPSLAGTGTFTLSYTFRDLNNCIKTATNTIVVNPLPVVTCTGILASQCVSATAYALSGCTPAGGTYSGTAVTGTNFNASVAGVGSFNITYTYTNIYGCTSSATNSINVVALPNVTWTSSLPSQCASATSYSLSGGFPAGGPYSGTAVNGGVFNPSVAGAGTYTLTYSFKDINNCINAATNTIVVNPLPVVSCTGTLASQCVSATTYTLSGCTPAGGTYTGTGVTGTNFNASVAGTGSFAITYTLTNSNNCTSSATNSITVFPSPTAHAAAIQVSLCSGSTIQLIGSSTGGSGLGYAYSWSGPNNFTSTLQNPIIINSQVNNSGTYFLTVTDGNGCTSINSSSVAIIIFPLPIATASAAQNTVCVGSTINLLGSASSGSGTAYTFSWSGANGFTSNLQNPIINTADPAYSGSYYLTVTDGNACSSTNSANIIITLNPIPAAAGVITCSASVCQGQSGVAVSVPAILNASSYVWTLPIGTTVISGANTASLIVNFSSSAATGSQTITVKGSNTCGFGPISTYYLSVNPLPGAITSISGAVSVCSGQTGVSYVAGNSASASSYIWTLPTATTGTYNLNQAILNFGTTSGNITVKGSNSCGDGTAFTIGITVNPTPVIVFPNLAPVCLNAAPFMLNGASPAGGTYSGTSVAANIFNPSVSGSGTFPITYTYTNAQACSSSAIKNLTVNPLPIVALGSFSAVCADHAPITLSGGSPSGGTYSGTGVSANTFNPAVSGPGNFTITYSYTNAIGCSNYAYSTITVYAIPVVTWNNSNVSQCVSSTSYSLSGGSPAGGTYSGPGVNGTNFNAGIAGSGTHTLTYTYTNSNACRASITNTIVVNPLPIANAGTNQTINIGQWTVLSGSASNGSGNYSYQWTPSAMISGLSNIANPQTLSLNSSTTFSLVVTDLSTGCASLPSQVTITVAGVPLSVTANSNLTIICSGKSVNISALATGGSTNYTYSWSSVPAGFTSTQANINGVTPLGTTTYTVVVNDGFNTATSSVLVNVNPLPSVSFTGVLAQQCISSTTYALTGGLPANGTYSGTGVTGTNFNASIAGIGTFTLTYTFLNTTTGCTNSATNTITVVAIPVVTWNTTLPGQCINSTTFQLTGGNPAGGTYGGAGVTSGVFNASVAGVGTHVLTYSYKDANNCTNSATKSIIVNSLPIVTFPGPLTSVCISSTSYLLSGGTPLGGTYSGVGVSGNNFNASVAGLGLKSITYSYTDGNGCVSSVSAPITVNPLPVVTFTGTIPNQCLSSSTYTLTGGSPTAGVYSGAGVTGTNFNASLAGIGTSTISFTYTNVYGCTNIATNAILVVPLPTVAWTSSLASQCAYTTTYNLAGATPIGGTYSGNGVSFGIFNPSTAGVGTHTMTYTYTNLDGCTSSVTNTIVVNPLPTVSFAGTLVTQCESSTTYALTGGSPGGGLYSGTGVSSSNFNASIAGAGNFSLIYSYTNPATGCTGSASNTIQVNPLPATPGTITGPSTFCKGSTQTYSVGTIANALTYLWTVPTGATITTGSTTNTISVTFSSNAISGAITVRGVNACGNGPLSQARNVTVNNIPIANAGADQNITIGSTATLNGSASSGTGSYFYSWSPSASLNNSNIQNPTTISLTNSIQYCLTVTDASTACVSAADCMMVNVNGTPLQILGITTIPNPATICIGGSLQLNATVIGGTQSYTYLWVSNPAGFTSTFSNPVVTPTSTTIYTLSVFDGINTVSSIKTVTVNPLPAIAFPSLTQICVNAAPIILNTAIPAGGSYSGIGVNANSFSPSVSGVGTFPITYTYFSPTTGCTNTATKNQAVNPQPTVSWTTILPGKCISDTAFLLNGGLPVGGTYAGNGVVAGKFNPSSAGTGVHTINYIYSDINGCTKTVSNTITVNALPAVSFSGNLTPQCISSTAYALSGGLPLGGTYSGAGVNSVSGGFNANIGGPGIHTITYTYTNNNGCTNAASNTINVVPLPMYSVNNDTSIMPGATATLSVTNISGNGPFTYLWSNGSANSSIQVSPNSITTYSVTVDDNNGCSRTDEVTVDVNVSNELTILLPNLASCSGNVIYPIIVNSFNNVASISLTIKYNNQFITYSGYSNPYSVLSNGTLIVNSTNTSIQIGWFSFTPISISEGTLLDLNLIAAQGTSNLEWDLVTPGACYITDFNGNQIPLISENGSITTLSCSTVQGVFSYDNLVSTPLSNCQVEVIRDTESTTKAVTNSAGQFNFGNLPDGIHIINPSCHKPVGGINSTDALLILKHFVNYITLSGWKLKAADVDATHFINAADALMIAKRFVGYISTFPAGDWLCEKDTINVAGPTTITSNLKAICFGDVDGSYVPPAKLEPEVFLIEEGEQTIASLDLVEIPFRISEPADIGAVSLVMNIDQNVAKLRNVKMNQDGELLYNVIDNEVRISWYSLIPLHLNADDVLFSLVLELNSKALKNSNSEWLSIYAGSQIADADGILLRGVTLSRPSLKLNQNVAWLGQNIPNPFYGFTTIPFYIPEKAEMRLVVTDMLGQKVFASEKQQYEAGNQEINIKVNLLPGVYIYQIEVNGLQENINLSRRMVVE